MAAAERLQLRRDERLHADRKSRDLGRTIGGEAFAQREIGIELDRDLRARGGRETSSQALDERADRLGWIRVRRFAAEKDRLRLERGRRADFSLEGAQIHCSRAGTRRPLRKVAIGTDVRTKRQMDVESALLAHPGSPKLRG